MLPSRRQGEQLDALLHHKATRLQVLLLRKQSETNPRVCNLICSPQTLSGKRVFLMTSTFILGCGVKAERPDNRFQNLQHKVVFDIQHCLGTSLGTVKLQRGPSFLPSCLPSFLPWWSVSPQLSSLNGQRSCWMANEANVVLIFLNGR